jgi:ubiquitin-protein ligase
LQEPLPYAKVELKDKSELLVWKVVFTGPANSPYDKGVFELEVDLRQEYPFKHPQVCFGQNVRNKPSVCNVVCFCQVKFATKIYHPNVNRTDGTVCEEMLSHNWSPQTQMKEVLEKV